MRGFAANQVLFLVAVYVLAPSREVTRITEFRFPLSD
jgi:hypothetical protein